MVDEVNENVTDMVFRVVQVLDVTYDYLGATATVVLREAEDARRHLSIPVALADATTIHHAWKHIMGRRPTTNELVSVILQEMQADVIAARIVRNEGGVYYAELDVMTTKGRRVFDCRPSDAIAFGLRQPVPAPLLVAEVILADV
jgi:bifunctional DNase/RNase